MRKYCDVRLLYNTSRIRADDFLQTIWRKFFSAENFFFLRKIGGISLFVIPIVVTILGFVVHYKFSVHEIERVGLCFKWVRYHLPHCFGFQSREIVNVFDSVFTVGNAESKVKIERFEKFVAEKMPFDHSELVNRFGSHAEIYCCPNFPKPEKYKIEELMKLPNFLWDSLKNTEYNFSFSVFNCENWRVYTKISNCGISKNY